MTFSREQQERRFSELYLFDWNRFSFYQLYIRVFVYHIEKLSYVEEFNNIQVNRASSFLIFRCLMIFKIVFGTKSLFYNFRTYFDF